MSFAQRIGLPESVQTSLLLLAIALTLAPWFTGLTIGMLQLPKLDARRRRMWRIGGPLLLILTVALVFPVTPRPISLHLLAADVLENGNIDVVISNTGNSVALLTSIELEVIRDHGIASRSMLATSATYYLSIDDLAPRMRRRLIIRHLIAPGATERIVIAPQTTRAADVRLLLHAADGSVLQSLLNLRP